LADPTAGTPQLRRITQTVQQDHRTDGGFDFFLTVRGFAHKDLRRRLLGKTSAQLSRLLKRLGLNGLAQKIPRTYFDIV
jgi:hypothetical protein